MKEETVTITREMYDQMTHRGADWHGLDNILIGFILGIFISLIWLRNRK